MRIKQWICYFAPLEWGLLLGSWSLILLSYLIFDRGSILPTVASLIGALSLLFIAKGNPIGQGLTVVFSVLYGIVSYACAYYGEMITYLGMTAPMAIVALVGWLRHPHHGNRAQVHMRRVTGRETVVLLLLTAAVTAGFYFLLAYLHTASLLLSTVSVATSFAAVYLAWRRSPWYALAYAMNDAVLILLWILGSLQELSYLSVVVCFVCFLANDLYGFVSWRRIARQQAED